MMPAAQIRVAPGSLLLSALDRGPGRGAHLAHWGEVPGVSADELIALTGGAEVTGRGGAGFPFSRKVSTVMEHRRRPRHPVVVLNGAEGEPASAKDAALLSRAPHLALDGAIIAARAIGARHVHVVTSADRTVTTQAVAQALSEREAERADRGITWHHQVAAARFVSGQAQAVLELIAGRVGLPVTAWVPEAIRGVGGQPTLLANAETFAHVGALCREGVEEYVAHGHAGISGASGASGGAGTTLVTINVMRPGTVIDPSPLVLEVPMGGPLPEVVTGGGPTAVLTGGFHGTWASVEQLRGLTISRGAFAERGLALGAGVLAPLESGCAVETTAVIADYLASESAGRCGPCVNGLPALAASMADLVAGADTSERLVELIGAVTRRGACAHPDGTARLVDSLLTNVPEAVADHLHGVCGCGERGVAA